MRDDGGGAEGRGDTPWTQGETEKERKEKRRKTIKMRFSLRDTLPLLSLNHCSLRLLCFHHMFLNYFTAYTRPLPAPTVKHKPALPDLWGFYSFEGISGVWSGLMWSKASPNPHVKLLRVGRGRTRERGLRISRSLRVGDAALGILTRSSLQRSTSASE